MMIRLLRLMVRLLTSHMHLEHLTPQKHRAYIVPHIPNIHEQEFIFSTAGNEIAVRAVLADVITDLKVLGLTGEEYGTIELVLAEVMNNIVEHAYANHPGGIIKLEIRPKPDGLHCKLIDNGHSMPDGSAPSGMLASIDCEITDLPEGGFGWFLIRDLTRDLQYVRENKQNVLEFRFAIQTVRN